MSTVLFPFLGYELGGSHVSAFTLARQLGAYGIRAVVVCMEGSPIADAARGAGLPVEPSGEPPASRNNPVVDLLRIPRRLALLRRIRRTGTVVHCNDIAALQAWLVPAKLARLPVVYHHRSINRMLLPNRAIVQQADAVIAISDECRDNVAYLPSSRVRQILNPFEINMNADRAAARSALLHEFELPPDARLVGFVGNFWTRKRPVFFLEVAAALARVSPLARFVMFGRDGEITTAHLKAEAVRLGIADRTVFPGFRMPGERNIAALDVLLATAVREPFGRTLVEALLVGTPYVATDDAGHRETARRWGGGVLVSRDADADAVAAAVSATFGPERSPALTMKNREAVARDVSPERHARSVEAFYEDVLRVRG